MGRGVGDRAASKEPGSGGQGPRIRRVPGVDAQPARTRTSATVRSSRSTTRPASSWRTSARRKYYATTSRPEFQPQYDVVGKGYRQPGSAFKPFNYVVGIDDGALTAGTMLMDSATDFGGGYAPNDADNLERGPVRVRNALQFSLNIPSVKAMAVNKPDHVFDRAKDFGMVFQSEKTNAGLALALGVAEVRPVDLVTAYGTLANGGKRVGHTTILTITGPQRHDVSTPYVPPRRRRGRQARSRPSSSRTSSPGTRTPTSIRSGASSPSAARTPGARRPSRPAPTTTPRTSTLTATSRRPPKEGRADGAYALAVGVWNGNSDNTPVSTAARPVFSIDVSDLRLARLPPGGQPEVAGDPVRAARWPRPRTAIDPWTGTKARAGGEAVNEWFITGSQPKDALPENTCGDRCPEPGARRRREPSSGTGWRPTGTGSGARNVARARPADRTGRGRLLLQPRRSSRTDRRGARSSAATAVARPARRPRCIPSRPPIASGVIPSFVLPSPSGSERGRPCPARPESPSASPSDSAVPVAEPTPSRHADADAHARTDTGADADANAHA